MTSKGSTGYFIDFINDATDKEGKNLELGKQFIEFLNKTNDPNSLSDWFIERGYLVNQEDCAKLIKNKEVITNLKEVSNARTY